MKTKKVKRSPQLEVFEEYVLIEGLKEDDHLRLSVESPNVYRVIEHFDDPIPETKIILIAEKKFTYYFVPHGRKVIKINSTC